MEDVGLNALKLFCLCLAKVVGRRRVDHHSPVPTGRDVSASALAPGQLGASFPAPNALPKNHAVRSDRQGQRAALEDWIVACLALPVVVRWRGDRR